jgi:hypothetical protein
MGTARLLKYESIFFSGEDEEAKELKFLGGQMRNQN